MCRSFIYAVQFFSWHEGNERKKERMNERKKEGKKERNKKNIIEIFRFNFFDSIRRINGTSGVYFTLE